jgi:hypothetical protein
MGSVGEEISSAESADILQPQFRECYKPERRNGRGFGTRQCHQYHSLFKKGKVIQKTARIQENVLK